MYILDPLFNLFWRGLNTFVFQEALKKLPPMVQTSTQIHRHGDFMTENVKM